MSRTALLLVIAPLLACAAARSPEAPETPSRPAADVEGSLVARLQPLVDELARLGTGASLTFSLHGRGTTLSAGTRWEGGPAVRAETPFNVASVSKLLTAARVVDLAHRGRLELDAPVTRYLPGVVAVDAGGAELTARLTLRELLRHRAGLPHQPDALDPGVVGASWIDPLLLGKLASAWPLRLAAEPGSYRYSNLGYALLGAVIERTEGAPFAAAMATYLHDLGMQDSTFWPADLGDRAARGRVERGEAVWFHEPGWYTSRYALPFTGLWTTTPDLVHFGRTLIAAGADPEEPLHAMAAEGTIGSLGIGPVVRDREGRRSLEHDGGGPGFMSWILAIPEEKLVLAIACNADGETPTNTRRLAEVTAVALEALLPAPRRGTHAGALQ